MITQKRVWEGYVELFLSGESMIKGTLLQMIIFFFYICWLSLLWYNCIGFFLFFFQEKVRQAMQKKRKESRTEKISEERSVQSFSALDRFLHSKAK